MSISHRVLKFCLIITFSGCAFLGPAKNRVIERYVLKIPDALSSHEPNEDRGAILIVSSVSGHSIFDGSSILYSKDPATLESYKYSTWAEPLSSLVPSAIKSSIKNRASFRTVTDANSAIAADYMLSIRIVEFYHDAQQEPGVSKVSLESFLVSLPERSLISTTTFISSHPLKEYNARSAVSAFQEDINKIGEEISNWISANVEKGAL